MGGGSSPKGGDPVEVKDVATIVIGAITITLLFVNLVITLITTYHKRK